MDLIEESMIDDLARCRDTVEKTTCKLADVLANFDLPDDCLVSVRDIIKVELTWVQSRLLELLKLID